MLCFSLDRKSTRYAHNKVIDVKIVQDLPCCSILVSSTSLCNRRLLLSSYLEEEVDSDLVSHHYCHCFIMALREVMSSKFIVQVHLCIIDCILYYPSLIYLLRSRRKRQLQWFCNLAQLVAARASRTTVIIIIIFPTIILSWIWMYQTCSRYYSRSTHTSYQVIRSDIVYGWTTSPLCQKRLGGETVCRLHQEQQVCDLCNLEHGHIRALHIQSCCIMTLRWPLYHFEQEDQMILEVLLVYARTQTVREYQLWQYTFERGSSIVDIVDIICGPPVCSSIYRRPVIDY